MPIRKQNAVKRPLQSRHVDGFLCNAPSKKSHCEEPSHSEQVSWEIGTPAESSSAGDPLRSGQTCLKSHIADSSCHSLLNHPSPHGSQHTSACPLLVKLIDAGIVVENEPVSYLKKKDNSVLKEGKITRDGILCCCCGNLFLLAKFEVHAGSTLHRPSANIYLRDGRSLMHCQQFAGVMSKPRRVTKQKPKFPQTHTQPTSSSSPRKNCAVQLKDQDNDDICEICGDGGQLILCDSCPSAFHAGCLNLEEVPDGDWHCSRCQCVSCGVAKHDRDDTSMISCSQCHTLYHRGCAREKSDNANKGPWFCANSCRKVFKSLQRLVGQEFSLGSGLRWMLLRSSGTDKGENVRMKAIEKQVSKVFKLLDQCFFPIMDAKTGIDLIPQMVFNRESHIRRLDCKGFYTLVLIEGEKLVSAATVRTHGNLYAEMPLIGTSHRFRNMGMCRVLMQALEGMMQSIGIYRLIIPSIDHMVQSWTNSFGFKLMDGDRILNANLLLFPGTTVLFKDLGQSSQETNCQMKMM